MRKARDKTRPAPGKEEKPDMTPMIDAVFLLIIFFLCIDFKTLEAKLPAYLPKDKGSQPQQIDPKPQLRLRIELAERGREVPRPNSQTSYHLVGHQVRYSLGPSPATDLSALQQLLEVQARPEHWVEVDGQRRPQDLVIEPGPGVVYADVAHCLDTVRDAGFAEVSFGGGLRR